MPTGRRSPGRIVAVAEDGAQRLAALVDRLRNSPSDGEPSPSRCPRCARRWPLLAACATETLYAQRRGAELRHVRRVARSRDHGGRLRPARGPRARSRGDPRRSGAPPGRLRPQPAAAHRAGRHRDPRRRAARPHAGRAAGADRAQPRPRQLGRRHERLAGQRGGARRGRRAPQPQGAAAAAGPCRPLGRHEVRAWTTCATCSSAPRRARPPRASPSARSRRACSALLGIGVFGRVLAVGDVAAEPDAGDEPRPSRARARARSAAPTPPPRRACSRPSTRRPPIATRSAASSRSARSAARPGSARTPSPACASTRAWRPRP